MKSCVSKFGISSQGTHISVIDFSVYAYLAIRLRDYTDVLSFNNAVDTIPLIGYMTRIDLALTVAKTDMFNSQNGARENVTKVLVLMTDGSQTQTDDITDPLVVAEELRELGIHLFAVGIGDEVNQTELMNIAGGPRNVFSADSFDDLSGSQVADNLVNLACSQDLADGASDNGKTHSLNPAKL